MAEESMNLDLIHTRREFLHRGLALVSAAATVPVFLEQTARAFGDPRQSDSRILVVVQLAGGNDGLNTVVPYLNDDYYRARPRLGIAKKDALRLTDRLGLHPAAGDLKQLYDDGLLTIVQGVGYPNPDRSHFVSTDIWASGDPTGRKNNGWLGRYLDCTCKGHDRPEPELAIATVQETPLALQGERFRPVAFGNPDELAWRGGDSDGAQRAFEALNTVGADPAKKSRQTGLKDEASALTYLRRAAMDARASAEEIRSASGGGSRRRGRWSGGGGRRSGNGLAGQLEMVRRMIVAGLPTKVYYVSLGGFDTHANQAQRHPQLIGELGKALRDFTTALRKDGLLDRVLVMTFSEFGRRVAENGSGGTDHGVAAPLFVVGSRVRPGLHGQHPSLAPADLDQGDLKWHVDFRSVYAAVLKDWLATDPAKVLSGRFSALPIVR